MIEPKELRQLEKAMARAVFNGVFWGVFWAIVVTSLLGGAVWTVLILNELDLL